MADPAPLLLIDRLKAVADLWCAATGRSLGALSTMVTNQGSFFERLGASRTGATTVTLEKFGGFFADPASWPDETIPAEAATFARITGAAVGCAACGAIGCGCSDLEYLGFVPPLSQSLGHAGSVEHG